MPKYCFVPGCRSLLGSRVQNPPSEKRHFFHFPKDPELFERWKKAIPSGNKVPCRVQSGGSKVCDIHFDESYIIKNDTFIIDGKEVILPRERWALQSDAIPTKFPNHPSYYTRSRKRRRSPSRRTSFATLKECKKRRQVVTVTHSEERNPTVAATQEASEKNIIQDVKSLKGCKEKRAVITVTHSAGSAKLHPTVMAMQKKASENISTVESTTINEFKDLAYHLNVSSSSVLPTQSWTIAYEQTDSDNQSLFISLIQRVNDIPSLIKTLEVSADLSLKLFAKGKRCEDEDHFLTGQRIHSLQDLKLLIQKFGAMPLCEGALPISNLNAELKISEGEKEGGTWYSKQCTIVIRPIRLNETRCKQCRKLRKTIQIKMNQNKNRTINRKDCQNWKTITARARKDKFTIKALKAKVSSLQSELCKTRSEIPKIPVLQESLESLPPFQKMDFEECLKKTVCSKNGTKYNKAWLLECLLMRVKCPKAYRQLLENNTLPHPIVIQRFISNISAECGFSMFALESIKKQMTGKSLAFCEGSLCFSEMKLQQSIAFNSNIHMLQEFVNFGEHESNTKTTAKNQLADHGLVFVFRSFLENWIQPIGVFLANNATPGTVLSKLLMESILLLENHGAKVSVVVCDGGTSNKALWEDLNISGKNKSVKNKLPHPCDPEKRDLYFMTDPPHLITCLRNHFLKHKKVQVGKNVASFYHYERLFEENEKHGTEKLVPKLTLAHIESEESEEMNVQLAMQLFSNTVANSLKSLVYKGVPDFLDCQPTENYTRQIHQLFDVLNTKAPEHGIRPGSNSLSVICEVLELIEKTEEASARTGIPAFAPEIAMQFLRVTLNSVIEVISYLHSLGYDYVLTGKMNQDCLERLFELIRSAGKTDDHPTVPNFPYLFHLLSMYTPIKGALPGNVETSEEKVLAWIDDPLDSKKKTNLLKDSLQVTDHTNEEMEEHALLDHDYVQALFVSSRKDEDRRQCDEIFQHI